MKKELNFLEVKQIVEEMQTLVDSRVDKIYQPDGFLIRLHKTGEGKKMIKIEPNRLWITEKKPVMPEKIPGFCTKLRKELEGKKITKIEQLNNERIIKIFLETQKEKKYLIIELFANGNIIITDEQNNIICAKEEREWKDRIIKKKQMYSLPPKQIHPEKLQKINLGEFKTLSEKIDSEIVVIEKVKPRKSVFDKQREKILKMIRAQEQTVKDQEFKSCELQKKGEFIYENYQELKKIADAIKQEQKSLSLQEIRDKIKNKKYKNLTIKNVFPEKQTIIVEV